MKKLIYLAVFTAIAKTMYAQPCTDQVTASYSTTGNGPVCANRSLQLSATTISGASYSWVGPSSSTFSGQNPVITKPQTSASGNYTVTATVGSCVYTDVVNIVINPTPLQPIIAATGLPCEGQAMSFTLLPTPPTGTTFTLYSPPGTPLTAPISSLSPANNGLYKAIAINTDGCVSDTGTYHLTVTATPPAPTVIAHNMPVCKNDTLEIVVNPNTSSPVDFFTWSYAAANDTTSLSLHQIEINGNNTVIVNSHIGVCVSPPLTIPVSFLPDIVPDVKLAGDVKIQGNDTEVTLSASVASGSTSQLKYQWYQNGNAITGANQSSYTGKLAVDIATTDWFYVEAENDTACGGKAVSDTAYIDKVVGIDNLTRKFEMHLYPNPNNGTFKIDLPNNTEAADLDITNTIGQTVYKTTLWNTGAANTIDLPETIGTGVYILHIKTGEYASKLRLEVNK